MPAASPTANGYLSAANFNLFNNKVDAATVKKMIADAISALPRDGGTVKDSFNLPIGTGLQFKNGVLDVKK